MTPPDLPDRVPDDVTDRAARVKALETELEVLRLAIERQGGIGRRTITEARGSAAELRAMAATLKTTQRELGQARAALRALEARRSVRLAVRTADIARRIIRTPGVAVRAVLNLTRSTQSPVVKADLRRPATVVDEARLVDQIRRNVAGSGRTTGPLVSIVMLNRDGADHLRRVLPALASVTYRNIELIVVDNGSTDDSIAVIEGSDVGAPVRVIRNAENATFSAGNDQGIAVAAGEMILLLNNDIEPIDPGWLGCMVETLHEPGVVAVGARLIYPRTIKGRSPRRFPDLSLQHGGVGFRMVDGAPLPVPLGAGSDADSDWAGAIREVPAVTAACLLIRGAGVRDVGGFTAGYAYGQEDVDVCLKLRGRGGRLMYDGRAAMWHHESATRSRDGTETRRARVDANRDLFVGHWGVRLYRTVLFDAVRGQGWWRSEPLRIDVVSRPDLGRYLGESLSGLRALGWSVSTTAHANTLDEPSAELVATDSTARADILVVLDPDRDIRSMSAAAVRVALVTGTPDAWIGRPWLADFDLILATTSDGADALKTATGAATLVPAEPDALAGALADALASWLVARRVGIRIEVPSWDVAESWGDLHFARDLQRAFRRAGRPTRIHLRPDWASWTAAREAVSLQIFGRSDGITRPGQLNLLWQVSHPDLSSTESFDRHDVVFVASDSFASVMARLTSVPVIALHQATEPSRFRPEPSGPVHELLFVANSRGVRRHVIEDLLPTDHDLAVFGQGWTPERLDPRYLAGTHIPNDEVGRRYAAAAIVLNDHWPDMLREGFMSNRLYDAAAAGAFIISDGIEELDSEFDGGIVGYRDRDHLRELIDHYLAHPDERRALADRARLAVLARHTFDHRVRTILETIDPILDERLGSGGAGELR